MTINNPEQFCNSLWDWGCLNGCFGDTNIKPTDFDGIVERHGNFLVMETKLPGVELPIGQKITFDNLLHTGYFTILVIWGNPGVPERIKLLTPGGEYYYENTSLDTLRTVVSKWFRWANSQTPTPMFE